MNNSMEIRSQNIASVQEGDYDTLLQLLESTRVSVDDLEHYLPVIVTAGGCVTFASRVNGTPSEEKVLYEILVLAMNHLLYLDYEEILVTCVKHRLNQVFDLLVDNGIDYRLCADKVLIEVGDKPDDAKVSMFFKFVQEKRDLQRARPPFTIPLEKKHRFISYIHGARILGYGQQELREFWNQHDHAKLLLVAVSKQKTEAVEYLVYSSLCVPENTNESDIVFLAFKDGNYEIIRTLLLGGFSPDVMVEKKHAFVYIVEEVDVPLELIQTIVGKLPYDKNVDLYASAIDAAENPNIKAYLRMVKSVAEGVPETDG